VSDSTEFEVIFCIHGVASAILAKVYRVSFAGEEAFMESPERERSRGETLRSLGIVTAMAIFFFCWGLTIFYTVGEKGPPSWDFGTVQDIPGQSPYSTHSIKEVADLTPLPVETRVVVDPQHVDEPPGEVGIMEDKQP
jgi:hypothetical protein